MVVKQFPLEQSNGKSHAEARRPFLAEKGRSTRLHETTRKAARSAGVPHRVPEGRARGGAAARRLNRTRMKQTAAAGEITCGCRQGGSPIRMMEKVVTSFDPDHLKGGLPQGPHDIGPCRTGQATHTATEIR